MRYHRVAHWQCLKRFHDLQLTQRLPRVFGSVLIAVLLTGIMLAGPCSRKRSIDDRDRALIARTYVLARMAAERGDNPFGALLVSEDGEILREAKNAVSTSGGANAYKQHAERRLIRDSLVLFGEQALRTATLYSSTEPCSRCWAAIRRAGMPSVVYGSSARGMQLARGREPPGLEPWKILRWLDPRTELIGPVAEDEGREIHRITWGRASDE